MAAPKSRRVLRLRALTEKTGLGRDSIYKLIRQGQFPKQVKLSERASGWFEDEVDAYLEGCAARREAPARKLRGHESATA